MLIQNLIQNLPAFLGFFIGSSWLIYTSLLIAYKLDLIEIVANWFSTKKVLVPSLATFVLPFLFTYIYKEIPILIDRWRLRDFVGILGAIVGAILGFSISEFRQWKTEGQQINALRKMLKLEINQNLVLLTEFQNKANADIADIFEFVIKNSFPLWNYTVWQSQQMLLPIALLDEEINQIYILNKDFDLIIKKYDLVNKLVLKLSEIGVIKYSGAIEMGEAFGKMEVRDNLVKEVEKEWEELNKMITEIINNYVVKNFIGL